MVLLKQVTLVSWTQPSGPLCLWQYLNIAQVEWEGERQSGADDSGGVQGSCQRGWQLSIRWLIVVKSQWLQFFRPSLEIWYSSFSVATSESPISMVMTFPFLSMYEDKTSGMENSGWLRDWAKCAPTRQTSDRRLCKGCVTEKNLSWLAAALLH